MAIFVAAIGLVGLLCLADLLLTFGVIRRLREHTEQLAGLRGQDAPVSGLPYGATPEPFTALTASGERLDARLACGWSHSSLRGAQPAPSASRLSLTTCASMRSRGTRCSS